MMEDNWKLFLFTPFLAILAGVLVLAVSFGIFLFRRLRRKPDHEI